MRGTYARLSPERKNGLLLLYLLGFAILITGLYVYPVLGIVVLFAYPAGALLFGYATGDATRSSLAGSLSYLVFVLMILFSPDFVVHTLNPEYLFRFAGYHLILLLFLGVIGGVASKKESLPRILALLLAGLWILLFLSGIS
ncbi:MAG: hypothetical protein WC346_07015 [Methanogenium sp.]|jgi:hypothetical protein